MTEHDPTTTPAAARAPVGAFATGAPHPPVVTPSLASAATPAPRKVLSMLDQPKLNNSEVLVLAAVLLDPTALLEANLHPRHFGDHRHQLIWAAMQELEARREPVDLVTVVDRLRERSELEKCGGPVYLSQLLGMTATSAHVEHYACKVLKNYVRRQANAGLSDLAQAAERPGEDVAAVLDNTAELVEALHDELAGKHDLAALDMDAESLLRLKLAPRVSYVGEGLLPAGVYSLLAGVPGTGKTFLLVQLALAIAFGRDWLDIPTRRARVGILELENDQVDLQPRLAGACGVLNLTLEERAERLANMHILTPDRLGRSRLNVLEDERSIVRWIRKRGLDVLLVDSLDRTHSGNENEDMPRLVMAYERIARTTGVALLVLHHERKPAGDGRRRGESRSEDLAAVRGHGTLTATAKVVWRLTDAKQGDKLRVLRFAKVNLGRTPDHLWLEQDEGGLLHATEKPLDARARVEVRRSKLRELLGEAGGAGLTAESAAARFGLSTKTLLRDFEALGAIRDGGKEGRYTLASGAACER